MPRKTQFLASNLKVKTSYTQKTLPIHLIIIFIDKIPPTITAGTNSTSLILGRAQSMFVAPSTPYDILNIIIKLKTTNSFGYDGIFTKLVSSCI